MLTIKTAAQRQWYRLCVFIEIFEIIFHHSLVFLLFTLSVYLFAAILLKIIVVFVM